MTPAESEHREVRMWFKVTQQTVAALIWARSLPHQV